MTLVNLTDYLLVNSGTVTAIHWASEYQPPFAGRVTKVKALDGDRRLDEGAPRTRG